MVRNSSISYGYLAFLAVSVFLWASMTARAQQAPAPRLILTAEDDFTDGKDRELFGNLFRALRSGERLEIEIRGAGWLQLVFAPAAETGEFLPLGQGGAFVTIRSFPGEYWQAQSQTLNPGQLEIWGGRTALFNGERLEIQIGGEPGRDVELYRIQEIIIGLRGTMANYADLAGPTGVIRKRNIPPGSSVSDFIMRGPDRHVPQGTKWGCSEDAETVCGTDERQHSKDKRIGRIRGSGCTAFIFRDDNGHHKQLTAGHCREDADILEFNIKPSQPDGTIVASDTRDQYRIAQDRTFENVPGARRGNDWGVFRVYRNSETCKWPFGQQGKFFRGARNPEPDRVRVAGYGAAPGRDNRTLRSASGRFAGYVSRDPYNVELGHHADTACGSSGSPVMTPDDVVIGVHTHGGCHMKGFNVGTSLRHQGFWQAAQRDRRPREPPCGPHP